MNACSQRFIKKTPSALLLFLWQPYVIFVRQSSMDLLHCLCYYTLLLHCFLTISPPPRFWLSYFVWMGLSPRARAREQDDKTHTLTGSNIRCPPGRSAPTNRLSIFVMMLWWCTTDTAKNKPPISTVTSPALFWKVEIFSPRCALSGRTNTTDVRKKYARCFGFSGDVHCRRHALCSHSNQFIKYAGVFRTVLVVISCTEETQNQSSSFDSPTAVSSRTARQC